MNDENENQFDDDLDYQDYLSSIEQPSEPEPEPLPDVSQGRSSINSRYVARGKGKGR